MFEYQITSKGQATGYLQITGTRASEVLKSPNIQAVLAFSGNTLIGVLSFEVRHEMCRIYDLYVAPEYRHIGVAHMMHFTLCDYLREMGAGMVQILFPIGSPDTEDFIISLGYERLEHRGHMAEFELSDLLRSEYLRSDREPGADISIYSLGDAVGDEQVKSIEALMNECPFRITAEDAYMEYDHRYSMVAEAGGKAAAFLLAKEVGPGVVYISYLYLDPGAKLALVPLIKMAAERLLMTYGDRLLVKAYLSNPEIEEITDKLVKELRKANVTEFRRKP